MENFRIDETRGDLMSQSVDSAAGYGDQQYLRTQARLARSGEAPTYIRKRGMSEVVRIVEEYGSKQFADLLKDSVKTDTDET